MGRTTCEVKITNYADSKHLAEAPEANRQPRSITLRASIEIEGRKAQHPLMAGGVGTPSLVGYPVLEMLDFVVDPKARKLVPDPFHGGEYAVHLY